MEENKRRGEEKKHEMKGIDRAAGDDSHQFPGL